MRTTSDFPLFSLYMKMLMAFRMRCKGMTLIFLFHCSAFLVKFFCFRLSNHRPPHCLWSWEGTYEAGQRPCAGGRGVVPAQTRPPHVDRRGRPTPCKAARIDAGDPRLGLHHRWQPSPQDGTWAGRDAGGAGPISAVRSSRKPGRPYDRPAAGPAGLKPGPAGRGL